VGGQYFVSQEMSTINSIADDDSACDAKKAWRLQKNLLALGTAEGDAT
jgi:hypothetical protein